MGIELCHNNVSHDSDHHGDNGFGCGIASTDNIIGVGGIRPAESAGITTF